VATSSEMTSLAEKDRIQFNITAVTFVRYANGSRDSSVSIVTRLQAGKWGNSDLYVATAKEISLFLSLKIGTGAHRAFFATRSADKWAGCEADHHQVILPTERVGRLYRTSSIFWCFI